MYSWIVTVLLLASAAYCSGGQDARVPITRYTCTQPNFLRITYNDTCNVTSGLRTCETKGGARPVLLNFFYNTVSGTYVWYGNTNPFVVLDIPRGWCVGSVKMTFLYDNIPTLVSLSVHSSERLSNNTHRTMFSNDSKEGIHATTQVVMNLTTLACGKYLRIDMTAERTIFLAEIEVFDTGNITFTPPVSASGSATSSAIPTTTIRSSNFTITPIFSQPSITTFTPPFSASGSPTTTTIHSSSFTITSTSSKPSTSDTSTTTGPSSTLPQSPGILPSDLPVDQDNYVLPAAISVVAVLLVMVLIVILVVVMICIITHRHKTRKSLKVQHLPIHYRSTQSNVIFKDNQFLIGQSAVPTHDTNGALHKSHDGEIMGTPGNYTNLGPSESNHNVVQGAAGEPVAEGDVSRPASQASICSNEVSSKPTHDVFPSMLDQSFPIPASDEGGHHEVSAHWLPEGLYELSSNFQLLDEVATTDDSHKVLKDAEDATGSQEDTSSQLSPQAPCSAFPIVDSVYDTIDVAPDKSSEPDPSAPTYANVDPPSSSPMPAAAQPSKHSSSPKPPHLAESPSVPQEDHIYAEVDKSRKKSVSSAKSPPAGITHSTNLTHVHSEVDELREVDGTNTSSGALDVDLCGGLEHPAEDITTQPESITSSTTGVGAVPTQGVAMGTVYTEVDYSKKRSRRGEES